MIAEALEFIANLKAQSLAETKIDIGDPSQVIWLIGDKIVRESVPIPTRQHDALDIAAIVAIIERLDDNTTTPVVWVNSDNVTLIVDDAGYRANTVVYELEKTFAFITVALLAKNRPWFDQREFIRLLRIDLENSLNPGLLLDRVRKVRFENGAVSTNTITKDRESMGRQVHSAVSGEGEIPEEVILSVRVFEAHAKFPVKCVVDVDPVRGMFQLIPLPDEVRQIELMALNEIRTDIMVQVPDSVPVYLGRP